MKKLLALLLLSHIASPAFADEPKKEPAKAEKKAAPALEVPGQARGQRHQGDHDHGPRRRRPEPALGGQAQVATLRQRSSEGPRR